MSQKTLSNLDNSQLAEVHESYFGEVAIHFKNHSNHLLCPITESEKKSIRTQIQFREIHSNRKPQYAQYEERYLSFETLDNRFVYVKISDIADLHFNDDGSDVYGPYPQSEYGGEPVVCPNKLVWLVIEKRDFLDEVKAAGYTQKDIDLAIHDADHADEKMKSLATDSEWVLDNGEKRTEPLINDGSLIDDFSLLSNFYEVRSEIYQSEIFISKENLSYISFPLHQRGVSRSQA